MSDNGTWTWSVVFLGEPVTGLAPKATAAPAKRWRQKWFAQKEMVIGAQSWGPGVFWSAHTLPTKAEAVRYALGFIEAFPELVEPHGLRFLGAFPVEEGE